MTTTTSPWTLPRCMSGRAPLGPSTRTTCSAASQASSVSAGGRTATTPAARRHQPRPATTLLETIRPDRGRARSPGRHLYRAGLRMRADEAASRRPDRPRTARSPPPTWRPLAPGGRRGRPRRRPRARRGGALEPPEHRGGRIVLGRARGPAGGRGRRRVRPLGPLRRGRRHRAPVRDLGGPVGHRPDRGHGRAVPGLGARRAPHPTISWHRPSPTAAVVDRRDRTLEDDTLAVLGRLATRPARAVHEATVTDAWLLPPAE